MVNNRSEFNEDDRPKNGCWKFNPMIENQHTK